MTPALDPSRARDGAPNGRDWRSLAPLARGFAGYRPSWVGPDLLAGLTLAAIAIPEQMATARLAGLPARAGFIAFIAGSLAFAAWGATRRLSVGADSTITAIFAGALAMMATTGSTDVATLAAALAVLVGVLVASAGALRLAWIGNLLSIPVMTGFLLGVAAHIALSQLDRKSTRLNSSHEIPPRMPSSA